MNAIDYAPLNARREFYRLSEPLDLRGPIFLAALGLLLLDALVVFWLAGGISRLIQRRRRRRRRVACDRHRLALAT